MMSQWNWPAGDKFSMAITVSSCRQKSRMMHQRASLLMRKCQWPAYLVGDVLEVGPIAEFANELDSLSPFQIG